MTYNKSPWIIDTSDGCIKIKTDEGEPWTIAIVSDDVSEGDPISNAKLIRSAPELVELLAKIVPYIPPQANDLILDARRLLDV